MPNVSVNNVGYAVPSHPNSMGIVDHVFRNDEIFFVELYEPVTGMQATRLVRPTSSPGAAGSTNAGLGIPVDTIEYDIFLPYRTTLSIGGSNYVTWSSELTFSVEPAYVDRQLPTTKNYPLLDNPNFKIYKTPVDIGMILEHPVEGIYEQYAPSIEIESQEYNTDFSDDNVNVLSDRTIAGYSGEFGITAILNTDLDAALAPLYQADVTIQMPICDYVIADSVTNVPIDLPIEN